MALIVVTGPPASGKSTWVAAHAKPGDVVVDYDRLAAALTAPHPDTHQQAKAVRDVTFRARAAAIREALKHVDDVDVYVIHTLPPADAMTKYATFNARIVTVDPGRDVVMARIAEQRAPHMRAVAERWYEQSRNAPLPTQRPSSRAW